MVSTRAEKAAIGAVKATSPSADKRGKAGSNLGYAVSAYGGCEGVFQGGYPAPSGRCSPSFIPAVRFFADEGAVIITGRRF